MGLWYAGTTTRALVYNTDLTTPITISTLPMLGAKARFANGPRHRPRRSPGSVERTPTRC